MQFKKVIMKGLVGVACFAGLSMSTSVMADTVQMNQTMVQMVSQLDALIPLIDQAEAAQDPTTRVQFHFDSWSDQSGNLHPGLRQDVLKMRAAIINQINQTNLTPEVVTPIRGDYVGR